jgi:hypothetical protein
MSVSTIRMTAAQTINITSADGVLSLSVQSAPAGGEFLFTGSFPFQGVAGETLVLSNGEGVNIIANSAANPLTDITITWQSGVVNVVIGL